MTWPDGSSLRATRSRLAWPSTPSGSSSSAMAWSPHRKTSAFRASRRRIPSCSTGWRPSSSSNGWSRKALIRLIVTSATYRQSSRLRPDLDAPDPGNTLLARQNRFRVEAEVIRDLALAVAGLLIPEMGGPSIQPPLPTSLLNRPEFKSERLMAPSRGTERYRRGIYVNVQRTFPYPMFKDFDAADPTPPARAASTPTRRSRPSPSGTTRPSRSVPGHSVSRAVRECRVAPSREFATPFASRSLDSLIRSSRRSSHVSTKTTERFTMPIPGQPPNCSATNRCRRTSTPQRRRPGSPSRERCSTSTNSSRGSRSRRCGRIAGFEHEMHEMHEKYKN